MSGRPVKRIVKLTGPEIKHKNTVDTNAVEIDSDALKICNVTQAAYEVGADGIPKHANPALHIEDRLVVSNTNAEIGVEGDDTHVPGGNGYIEFTDGTRMYTKPKNTIIASNSVSPYQPFNAATTLDTKSLPNNGDAIFIQFIAPDTGVYNKVQLRLSNVDSNNELKSTGKIGVAIYDNLTTSINATPNVPDNRKGYGILTISDLQTAELRVI